jgi:hypothetical protein
MEKQQPQAQVKKLLLPFFTIHFPANFLFFQLNGYASSTETTYLGPQSQPRTADANFKK